MDRLNHLRGEAGGSRDSTLDTTSPPSESFMTANESSSKYFSLSEVDSVDSTFDISSIKDVSLSSTATDTEGTITNADELISNLSPIGKKSDMLDTYKIGKQIEAANILSGGVDIFDDNDNSYDGDELVIDDNVDVDDKSNSEMKQPEEMQFKSDENMIESTLINEEMDIASKDTEVVLQIDGKNVDAIDIGNGLYLYRKEGQEELAAVQIIDDDQQQTSFKFLKVRENAEGNLEVYEEIEIEVPKEVPAKEGKMPEKKTSSHVPITDINKVISESGCNKVAERKTKVPRKEPILTRTEVDVDGNKESSSDAKTELNINGKMMKFSESRKSPVIGSYTPMTYHSTPNKERIPLTKTMVDQQLHPNRHSDNVKKTIEVHTDSSKQRTAETPIKNKDVSDDNTNVDVSGDSKSLEANDDGKNVDVNDDCKNVDVNDGCKNVDVNDDCKNVDVNDGCKNVDVNDECKIVDVNDECKIVDVNNDKKNIDEISEKELVIDESVEKVDISKEADKNSTVVKNLDSDNAKVSVPSTNEVLNEKCDDVIELPADQENVVDSTDKDMTCDKAIIKEKVEDVKVCEEHKEEKSSDKNLNVIEKTDVVFVEEVVDSPGNKVEEKIEEPVPIDQVEIGKKENVKVTNQVEAKPSESVPISEDEGIRNIDVTNKEDKVTVIDNTQCDNQDKTKIEEIIYDVTTDQDNDDIIIIDDSEIDDSKMEDKTSDVKVEAHKQSNVESGISKENEAITKINECPGDKNKKESSVTPKANLENHEEPTKSELSMSNEITKISQSKIPIPTTKTESVTKEPIKSENLQTKDLSIPINLNKEKVELNVEDFKEAGLTEKNAKEVVKHIPVAEVPTQPYSKLEKPQKLETKVDKSQDKLIYVPEALTSKTTAPISSTTSKTEVMPKKENNVLEKSPKKLSKPVPFAESQSSIMPLKIDSTTNIKADASEKSVEKSNKVPSREVKEQKPVSSQNLSVVNLQMNTKDADIKIAPKESIPVKQKKDEVVKSSSVPKEEQPSCSGVQDVTSTSTDSLPSQSSDNKHETGDARDDSNTDESGGSKEAVPFGKWTATNRKEFLIKIKTRTTVAPAVPSTSSNQLKNTNDLNRRDVLQKIDSQRQQSNNAAALAKNQEANKNVNKNETAFVSKTNLIQKKDNIQEVNVLAKPEIVKETSEAVAEKAPVKEDVPNNIQNEATQVASVTSVKKDSAQRTEVNYQDLIDKTIEDMIHRTVAPTKPQDEPSQTAAKESNISQSGKFPPNYKPTDQATLDEIEMKMNELHGIPFIERPPHELPVVPVAEPVPKTYSKIDKQKSNIHNKTSKIPNLLPFSNKNPTKIIKDNVIEVDSEDEVIEHEPITGDIAVTKKTVSAKLPPKEKAKSYANTEKSKQDAGKKEPIITEKDFDKFARRNSKTYENCLTMNLDSKDSRNVIQTVVEKDLYPKSYSKNDIARVDPKAKAPYKYQNVRPNVQPAKVHGPRVGTTANEDSSNRNQSKLQKAYHSALSAKRQLEGPITIIEDKPVKVVFMDNMEFVPSSLNLQGQHLSPAKKLVTDSDNFTVSTLDSLESETLDTTEDSKAQEEIKTKSKHQRKQVLTPVDEPELELIEPKDLGLEASPKKKRKTEEEKTDKTIKYPMRKKYYLIGSNPVADDKYTPSTDVIKNPLKETVNLNDNGVSHKNAVSAIDNLVKAAELLEHQSENRNIVNSPNTDSQQSTPVKRGRGRPRKYPLPEGGVEKTKVPSPQKKPRLIDAKVPKRDPVTTTDDDDDDSDDAIIKENWTMGKINENIVCPICNKLFRTENVVFKHVKHCTGPSPSRSGSDKRSPRRMRPSQESDSKSQSSKSDDMDLDDDKPLVVRKETPKKRKSKDSIAKFDDKDEVIVIEDTPPIKEKPERKEKEIDDRKIHESRKPRAKLFNKGNDLVCEFCGKTFRQLSYLVSHKLQHKKEEPKKVEKEAPTAIKSVYSCEVCKKDFRKLHHLVQHRIIHNPSSAPTRTQRKSSSEQSDTKIEKEPNSSKHSEDASAGFRCEPCDKSFRKLHHLVEHRETHDGINRQKTTPAVVQNNVEKPVTLHQCEVCKKTFRKLHHLIEHKEQHVETSSEKSDDKSVKSSLSTKDIIHECSLCYMVFPNEHSLNKHTIICLRKKRQSKQAKPVEGSEAGESVEDSNESARAEEKSDNVETPKVVEVEVKEDLHKNEVEKIEVPVEKPKPIEEKPAEVVKEVHREIETVPQKIETKPVEPQLSAPTKREFSETENVKTEVKPEVPEKIKKVEVLETKDHETPKKKVSPKEKSTSNINKRLKTTSPAQVSSSQDNKPAVESSDDDEVRYMLNPNFQVEDVTEEKVFMKVRANKRSSLQIERPNSKDLVKRRTSLQHPPKIPRLKPKPVEPASVKIIAKTPKVEPLPSTDSDDSETVKYSFPKTIPEKSTKPAQDRTPQKKTLADKRKSLSGIAKRKSLGKAVIARHKPLPVKQIKRRTLEVEHRCDCGQLFSSAALLSRHTTLAHTPPRIRRRRSPPPEVKPVIKPAPRKSSVADKPKQAPASRKSSTRSDSSTSTNAKLNKQETKQTRKSLDKDTKTPAEAKKPKPEKSEAKSSVKPRRTGAHRGVPVPEKMRKLMQKNNK